MVMRRAACVAALALAGCDYLTSSFETNEFSGDWYPIEIDNASGAVIVGVRDDGEPGMRRAVLDVLSPLTLIDHGATAPVSVSTTNLTILGARTAGGELDLPRAVITDQQVVTLHPCQTPECVVGTPTAPSPFDALVGINAFAGEALRLRLATDQIFILPGIAGSDLHLARSCDAVFDSPFWGGGTLLLGGTEVGFGSWRIALDTCIAPKPERLLAQSARGVNALFVLSTGIGPSLLGRTAYERYREIDPTLPPVDTLPEEAVLLPSGPVVGSRTTLPSIALVGNSTTNPQGPCRQMYASHVLAVHDCVIGEDCPCPEGEDFCPIPAVVELAPVAGLNVLVVPDSDQTLQSLRAELRSAQPEVDGILGSEAIEALQLDIDVVHDRLVMRCVDRATCGARVALPNREARSYVNGCLRNAPGPIVLVE
jgi:hypothetical protein